MLNVKQKAGRAVFLSRFAFLLGLCLCLAALPARAGITLTDAAGRTVVLTRLPERIVVIGAAPFIPLHMLYMFRETREKLVGYEQKVKEKDPFLRLIDPDFSRKTPLNTNPAVESILALKPDLIIAKAGSKGVLADSLAPLGIPLMTVGIETPERFIQDIENFGRIFNNPDRARRITAYVNGKLKRIAEKTASVKLEDRPRVLVLEYSNRGKSLALNVPAPSWIQTRQAVIAGGKPVWTDAASAGDGWQITGFEQIAGWNPDKIFLVVWYRLKGQEVLESLYRDGKWQQLKAVQNRELYLFPQDIYGWDSLTPRWILGALWMTRMTCPQAFGPDERPLDDLVTEFYQTLYFMDDASIKAHILPETAPHAVE